MRAECKNVGQFVGILLKEICFHKGTVYFQYKIYRGESPCSVFCNFHVANEVVGIKSWKFIIKKMAKLLICDSLILKGAVQVAKH